MTTIQKLKQRLAVIPITLDEAGRKKKLEDYKKTRTFIDNAGEFYPSQHEDRMKQNEEYISIGRKIFPKGSNAEMTYNMKKLHARLAAVQVTGSSTVKINPEHGKIIADAYENMKHGPNHPAVKASYDALINEIKTQFKDLINKGLKIDKMKSGTNPYPTSREMHEDVEKNNHLYYFPTAEGYGAQEQNKNHPMLQETEFKHENQPLLANDMFRIVHDVNGHHIGGKSGFGPKGEHQAYLTHKKMYSPLANKALFTETAGQNNYVNFGPNGESNRKDPKNTIYAEQKAGLMPDEIINGNIMSKRLRRNSPESVKELRMLNHKVKHNSKVNDLRRRIGKTKLALITPLPLKKKKPRIIRKVEVKEAMINLHPSADDTIDNFSKYLQVNHNVEGVSGVYDPIKNVVLDARIPEHVDRLHELFGKEQLVGFNSITDTRLGKETNTENIRQQLKEIEGRNSEAVLGFDEGSLEAVEITRGKNEQEILDKLLDHQNSTGVLYPDRTFKIIKNPKYKKE